MSSLFRVPASTIEFEEFLIEQSNGADWTVVQVDQKE